MTPGLSSARDGLTGPDYADQRYYASGYGRCQCICAITEAYPPIAISAPCPREIWPEYPVNKTIDAIAIAKIAICAP